MKPTLELLASPPGTGKTSYCIELFTEQILKTQAGIDSRSFFILPSREHADRIRALIFKKDIPGLFNAHILTINDFAATLLSGGPERNPTDSIRKHILREILSGGDFPYFQDVADAPGFYDLLIDAIKEFKANLVSIREFEKASQPLLKNPLFRMKFKDFSVVLKKYEAALKELGLKEPEDDIANLAQKREGHFFSDLVVFDGFFHFTRSQKFLIETLSSLSSRVVVSLTLPFQHEKRNSLFTYPQKTREFLLGIGFKESSDGIRQNHRTKDKALLHLEQNLFQENPGSFDKPPDSLALFEAYGVRGEIEMIAREIKKLYRQTGVQYSDICIILRTIGNYEKIIDSVFREYEIPVMIHERKRLIEHSFTMTLFRFFNLPKDGWKREDLFYFLKSSFLAKTISLEDVLALEWAAIRKNILEGKDKWLESVKDPAIPETVRKLIERLAGWESIFLTLKNAGQFKTKLDLFLKEFQIVDFGFFAETNAEHAVIDSQVYKTIVSLLENLRKYYAASAKRQFLPIKFIEDFQDFLKKALFSVKLAGKNRVQVYDVVMAMPKEYKIVFMAGLLEKNFPLSISEDPLFKDAERKIINQKGVLLEERRWRLAGERYFFYMGVTRAKEKLYFCYPLYGAEGKPSLPSFFVEEVKKCFKGQMISFSRKRLGDFLPHSLEWESSEEGIRGVCHALFCEEKSIKNTDKGLHASLPFFFNHWVGEERFRSILNFGYLPDEAVIRDERIKDIFSKTKGPFSATRLEIYATCAFKYFSSKILHLTEPLEGREFIEMGNVMHRVLEEFYKELPDHLRSDKNYWNDLTVIQKTLHGKLDTVLETNLFEHEPLYRQRSYRQSMKETLDLFAREEQALFIKRETTPSYFEFKFEGLKIPGLDGQSILFEGKIDRVDVVAGGEKALVVDYKRSKRPTTIADKLSKGLELQLPLYILAVEKFLKLDVIGAELRFLKDSKKEGLYREAARESLDLPSRQITYEDAEFRKVLSQTEKRVAQNVKRLQNADISVKSKTCDFCSFNPICRFEKWKLIYQEEAHDGVS